MITADYIREIDFSTSMSGYKKGEVDDFLDEVADAFDDIVKENNELKSKLTSSEAVIATPSAKIEEPVAAAAENTEEKEKDYTATTESVHSILESAQRFADQLVSEAKEKAEAIIGEATLKAKQINETIESEKAESDAQIANKLKIAADKSEGIIVAAKDSVERQQLLFDKIRAEADIFKTKLLDMYKSQLELLNKFPKEVPFNAQRAAEALEFIIDNKPDFNSFIPAEKADNEEPQEEVKEDKNDSEGSNYDVGFFGGLQD